MSLGTYIFPRYGYKDRQFTWVPSHKDWAKVEYVYELLGVFDRVTKIVFASDYPVANLFLSEIWQMKDTSLPRNVIIKVTTSYPWNKE